VYQERAWSSFLKPDPKLCEILPPAVTSRQLRVVLLIALLALGQHRLQRGRCQRHHVRARPRRLLQLRHQRCIGAAQPLRVKALVWLSARRVVERPMASTSPARKAS